MTVAIHDNVLVEVVRVDVFRVRILPTALLILLIFKLCIIITRALLAFNVSVASVRKLALLVSTLAILGIVRTLDDVALVTFGSRLAIPK